MQGKRGFTLIELMVTIAVMAIIAMIAAPSFGNLIARQNLNKSTQELIATLQNARAKAVLERSEITVKLNSEVADTSKQLNWKSSGKAVLVNSPTEIKFIFNGGVKDATADTNFKICDKAGGAKSKMVGISPMGTIQQIVEGTC